MDLSNTTLALIAMISVFGLVGVLAVDTIEIVQNAEARGCPNSVALQASQGRCFKG